MYMLQPDCRKIYMYPACSWPLASKSWFHVCSTLQRITSLETVPNGREKTLSPGKIISRARENLKI